MILSELRRSPARTFPKGHDIPSFVGGLISRGATVQHALDVATSCLAATAQADMCTLFVPNSAGDGFVLRAASGVPRVAIGRLIVRGSSSSATAFVAGQKGMVIFDDLHATSRFSESDLSRRYAVATSVAVPLRSNEQTVAVLGLHWKVQRRPTDEDQRLLVEVGEAVLDLLTAEVCAGR